MGGRGVKLFLKSVAAIASAKIMGFFFFLQRTAIYRVHEVVFLG